MTDNRIRAFGLIAIIGGLLNIVADLFIVSQPIPADNEGLQFLEIMPIENVTIGVVLGFFALSSWLLILPSLSAAITRASDIERWLAKGGFALFVTTCVTFHCLYWPITVAIQATAGAASQAGMLSDFVVILGAFQAIIIVSALVMTLSLASTILRKRADYPWWILLINPIVTLPTLGSLVSFITTPYYGYAAGSMATFFSTIFIAGLVYARRSTEKS